MFSQIVILPNGSFVLCCFSAPFLILIFIEKRTVIPAHFKFSLTNIYETFLQKFENESVIIQQTILVVNRLSQMGHKM